jgi:hypothetical protein
VLQAVKPSLRFTARRHCGQMPPKPATTWAVYHGVPRAPPGVAAVPGGLDAGGGWHKEHAADGCRPCCEDGRRPGYLAAGKQGLQAAAVCRVGVTNWHEWTTPVHAWDTPAVQHAAAWARHVLPCCPGRLGQRACMWPWCWAPCSVCQICRSFGDATSSSALATTAGLRDGDGASAGCSPYESCVTRALLAAATLCSYSQVGTMALRHAAVVTMAVSPGELCEPGCSDHWSHDDQWWRPALAAAL